MLRLRAQASIALQAGRLRQDWGRRGVRLGTAIWQSSFCSWSYSKREDCLFFPGRLIVVPVPFASVIGPLVVWMIKKDEDALVDDQGKEAVNFQISVALYCVLCLSLVFVLIGVFLIGALSLFGLICVIVAAMKANDGEPFRYPLCIRFIK